MTEVQYSHTDIAPRPEPAQRIATIDAARYEAIVDERWDDAEAAFHPELRYTHANGVTDTRESYLAKLRGGYYDYHRIDHDTDQVWAGSDVVLMWGRMTADLRAGTLEKRIDNRILTVWTTYQDWWVLLAQQPTPVQKWP